MITWSLRTSSIFGYISVLLGGWGRQDVCLFFASVLGKSQFEFKGRLNVVLEEKPGEDY